MPALPLQLFRARRSLALQTIACFAGALALFGLFAVLFVLAIFTPGNAGSPPIGAIFTSIFAVMLLGRGIFLLRSTTAVSIDPLGLTLNGFFSSRHIPWSRIHLIARTKRRVFMGDNIDAVNILDANNKILAGIPDAFENFTDLVNAIESYAAANLGHAARDAAVETQHEQLRTRKSRRFAIIISSPVLVLFAIGFVMSLNEYLYTRRFPTEGIKTAAHITRHWIYNVTPRLQYSFLDAQGREHSGDVAMKQPDWDALTDQTTVPIEYLSSSPDWHRLLAGDDEPEFGLNMIFLSAGGFLIFAFLVTLLLLGFEIESKQGRFIISRHGRLLKVFGPPFHEDAGLP